MAQDAQQEEGFLDVIWSNPDDDTSRLVYSDWLDDHDNGDGKRSARAEFIHLQYTLENPSTDLTERQKLLAREQELLAQHRADWEQSLQTIQATIETTYQRGFVHGVTLRADDFLRCGARIFAAAPTIREAYLHNPRGTALGRIVQALACSPHLERLTALRLHGGICSEGVMALAASQQVENLKFLDLRDNAIDAEGAQALASSAHLAGLRALNLAGNSIGDAGLRALASSPQLTNLESLDIGRNRIGLSGAQALASSAHLAGLRALNLAGNSIGDAGLRALASSPQLANLESLGVGGNDIVGVRALVASPYLTRLKALNLGGNNIGDGGVDTLAASAKLGQVTALTLSDNLIGETGASALAASPHVTNLRLLDLSHNAISAKGVRALATSPRLAQLVSLDLSSNSYAPTMRYEKHDLLRLRNGRSSAPSGRGK